MKPRWHSFLKSPPRSPIRRGLRVTPRIADVRAARGLEGPQGSCVRVRFLRVQPRTLVRLLRFLHLTTGVPGRVSES